MARACAVIRLNWGDSAAAAEASHLESWQDLSKFLKRECGGAPPTFVALTCTLTMPTAVCDIAIVQQWWHRGASWCPEGRRICRSNGLDSVW